MRLTPWLNTLDVNDLARLLTLRVDACLTHPGSVTDPAQQQVTTTDLAQQLSTPASVAAAVSRLDQDSLLVAQSVVVLGDGTDANRVREFVRGADHLLDAALERLSERALVWPGNRPGLLRITVALDHHWPLPLGLGPTAATVLDPMTKDPIREIAQRLGAPKGNTRDDAIRNVCQALSNAPAVRERAASASPAARALLEDLVWNPASLPPPRHAWQDQYHRQQDHYHRQQDQDRLPAEELYDLGLLLSRSNEEYAVVPRETALAVRGPQWGPQLSGAPAGPAVPVQVDADGDPPGLNRERPDPRAVAKGLCHQRADLEARVEQAVDRLTSRHDGRRLPSRMAPEKLRLLAEAQEQGLAVLVEYSRSFTSRASCLYRLDEVSLGHAQVRAWNPEWESDVVFHLHELINVEPA